MHRRPRRFLQALAIAGVLSFVVIPRPDGSKDIRGGDFEASGVAAVPGTNGALVVDDSSPEEVLWVQLDRDGGQIGDAIAIPLGVTVVDAEDITTDGESFYVVGSLSKQPRTSGVDLVRFQFDAVGRRVEGLQTYRGLADAIVSKVPSARGTLNIEGLAWDPRLDRLLVGLRSPVAQNGAFLIPLKVGRSDHDPSSLTVEAGAPFHLPLGGDGVRGLAFDASANRLLVISGAAGDDERAFRLLEWPMTSSRGVREVMRFSRAVKPEGIASLTVNGVRRQVVVFDTGRYLAFN